MNTSKIEYKSNIELAISQANVLDSNIPQKALSIPGFSSPKVRMFLNNLIRYTSFVNYLEIGSFKGSTFVSAISGNNVNSAYAIDNWSEFNEYCSVKDEFLKNTEGLKFTFIENDCFNINTTDIKDKINVYFFDSEHTYESHYNALTHYISVLSDDFIFIVDDFDPFNDVWSAVEKGTRDSIRDLKLEIIYERHITSSGRNAIDSWWNGIYVAHLRKTNGNN